MASDHERGNGSGSDGRNVDPGLGLLLGEASGQRVETRSEAWPSKTEPWGELPTRSFEGGTYYDRPLLKEPVWIWAVPLYFYVGGTAGAAAVLAASAQALGGDDLHGLVKSCRWVAAIGGALGSGLLIHDLGRPERFLHMLRVFRPTSPMSVGSWVLAAASSCTAVSALLVDQEGALGQVGDVAGYSAALFGLPLAGYTSVLLTNTAVPVWRETRRSLPPLFVGSAVSGLASLFGLLPVGGERERAVVERFGVVGKVADLAGMAAVERDANRVREVGRPLREGLSGTLWRAARMLTAGSLALSLVPGRSRAKRVVSGVLGTAGALALRFSVYHAGRVSARDPRATFASQRRGSVSPSILP
jgi:formate-dependent nitrite reductase membrane component NrfD